MLGIFREDNFDAAHGTLNLDGFGAAVVDGTASAGPGKGLTADGDMAEVVFQFIVEVRGAAAELEQGFALQVVHLRGALHLPGVMQDALLAGSGEGAGAEIFCGQVAAVDGQGDRLKMGALGNGQHNGFRPGGVDREKIDAILPGDLAFAPAVIGETEMVPLHQTKHPRVPPNSAVRTGRRRQAGPGRRGPHPLRR